MKIIIKIGIVAGAAWLFPERVVCKDARTMALAVIVMIITGIILGLVALGILAALTRKGHEIMAIAIVLTLRIASGIIQLMAATRIVDGFEIHGIITYTVIALLIGICSTTGSEKKNK